MSNSISTRILAQSTASSNTVATLNKAFRELAAEGNVEKLKEFYSKNKGIDPREAGLVTKRSALHQAAIRGHRDMCIYLIETHKLSPRIKDKDNNTPQMLARSNHFIVLANELATIERFDEAVQSLFPNSSQNTPVLHDSCVIS